VQHASRIELVLVDFDDTIVDTAPRFQRARQELFELLVNLGFEAELVRQTHHEEIDPIMRQRYGFGPQRLEHAFRETYEQLCNRAALGLDESIAMRCALLGRTVAGTPPLLEGSLEALRRLSDRFPTVLYTQSGNYDYQLACVTDSGVLEVVRGDRVHIAERKTTDHFQKVMREYGVHHPQNVWMIGNSMRSDINPALECGAHAIFVDVDNPWEFDVADPYHEDFHRVRTFPEAVDFLLSLEE
jgi:putative hydrolase of the HAD superfamily